MNRDELREEVIKKFHEGQQVPIRIVVEGKKKYNCTTAKIEKFNPSTVLTEHNGYKESFTPVRLYMERLWRQCARQRLPSRSRFP
jgi:hypothetical protein